MHWKDTTSVLWPELGYDQLNIWSGHLVLNQNVPTIFYTGVDIGYEQTVCTAYSLDSMKTFIKHPDNPLIVESPSDYVYREFRDPYVFRENGYWYMAIGSGIEATPSRGAALLYKSKDLVEWEYLNPLFAGNPTRDGSGVFWEMPVFHRIGDKHLLLINTIPLPEVPAQTLYWVGSFSNEKFVPDHPLPKKLELINWFLVPCINYDEEGRLIAMGFIADHLPLSKQFEKGWTHTFSLPRVWGLKENELIQSPHPYLRKLRENKTGFNDITLYPQGSNFLQGTRGLQLEIEATIKRGTATKVGFVLGKSNNGNESTDIYYDYTSSQIVVDRTKSSLDPTLQGKLTSEKLQLPNTEEIDWRIFLDGSVIEVFVNNESAFATRMYPVSPQSDNVDIFIEGGSARADVNIWQMKFNSP